ncbi:MAG: GNAT family N-acetyltransferase [Nanoarchaeota archaeon]
MEEIDEIVEDVETADLMRSILRKRFELFDERHTVRARRLDDDESYIGYRTTDANIPQGSTHFDLNLIGNICYLLHIELGKEARGNGYGKQMYDSVEDFAKAVGCDRVRMMPFGRTATGESRRSYLHRKGYRDVTHEGEVEKLLTT